MNIKRELEERYPVYKGENIREINAIFSFSPHANEKYVVKPKFHLLHVLTSYVLYSLSTTPFPLSLGYLPLLALSLYGFYAMKTSYEHELSHSYRIRYYKFMESVKGKKEDPKLISFIDKLEREALNSSSKIKSSFLRELALLFSIPIVMGSYFKRSRWYWEEELAKYEAEKFTGIKANSVSKEKRKFFETLESFRTDKYVPIKCEELEEDLRFYLEHPPAIVPKYDSIKKLYKMFSKEIH
jgi:hypothetical protein